MCQTGARWLLFVSLSLLGGCGGPNGDLGSGDLAGRKIRVVTTTGMITDIVAQVGGDRLEVAGLMGPGEDPHLYKATEGDVGRLSNADIVFYNGLHLEGKLGDVLARVGSRIKTVAVTESLDAERDIRPAPPGFEGTHDPHVWFDVSLWMKAVGSVRDRLSELDPTHAAEYRSRAEAYLKVLADLDREVKDKSAQVPAGQRVLITAHDAFYYFGHAYGFEVRGLQGVSTVAETGTDDVRKLAAFIADRKIPAIFVESSVPPRRIEAVRKAVEARGHQVRIGGELFSDALGSAGTPEGTYVGMVRHNIDTIVQALRPQP